MPTNKGGVERGDIGCRGGGLPDVDWLRGQCQIVLTSSSLLLIHLLLHDLNLVKFVEMPNI